jgi:hypothetical protein
MRSKHKLLGKVKCIRDDKFANIKTGQCFDLFDDGGNSCISKYIICEQYPFGRFLDDNLGYDGVQSEEGPLYELEEKRPKFKVGDKVRYIKHPNSHIPIGAIGVVLRTTDYDVYAKWDQGLDNKEWYVDFTHIELVEAEYIMPTTTAQIEGAAKTGLRYNSNKLRWRNFPMFLMKPLIEVAQYGETKYATFNFLDGQTINDSMDSLKRHLESFESPYEPDEDSESKVNHLAHVAWNALVALHMLKTRKDLDDRWKLPEGKS